MTSDLFRKEAIRHRTRALFGDVVLALPLSNWILSALVVGLFLAVIACGLFIQVPVVDAQAVMSEQEILPLWRWLFGV